MGTHMSRPACTPTPKNTRTTSDRHKHRHPQRWCAYGDGSWLGDTHTHEGGGAGARGAPSLPACRPPGREIDKRCLPCTRKSELQVPHLHQRPGPSPGDWGVLLPLPLGTHEQKSHQHRASLSPGWHLIWILLSPRGPLPPPQLFWPALAASWDVQPFLAIQPWPSATPHWEWCLQLLPWAPSEAEGEGFSVFILNRSFPSPIFFLSDLASFFSSLSFL